MLTTPADPGPCDVCGGALQPFRHAWLYRCESCGVLRSTLAIDIPDRPTDGALDEALREAGLERVREANNARLLAALKTHAPAGAKLLDVGSGPGFLLRQAAALGFEAQGVEPDANTATQTRAAGLAVRHGYFPQALGADERFDIIVFNDVIEHIPDLGGALEACATHLKPGGVLCLNCPDRRGLFFRTAAALDRLGLAGPYDRLWQKGLPSPHVWYFTSSDLSQAAGRRGFKPIEAIRLETVDLKGLWARIRYVRDQPLALSLAAYAFAVATYPLARLLPGDSIASLFRRV